MAGMGWAVQSPSRTAFYRELQAQVRAFLKARQLAPVADRRAYRKAALVTLSFAVAYVLFLFLPPSNATVLVLGLAAGLSLAAIAFNIAHDGNHGAYSNREWLNRCAGSALDLMGMSSYLWRWKHNAFHHSRPNDPSVDLDIDLTPLARLSPEQRHCGFHRYQHIYLWPCYSLVIIKWQFMDDIVCLFRGKIGHHAIPRPQGFDLLLFVGGKVLFVCWMFVIPTAAHSFGIALTFYLASHLCGGFVAAIAFQLAHCVEEAHESSGRVEAGSWAEHQLRCTVDFAPSSRFVAWYFGGLNFQVVHHLFPWISHVHYPAVSPIVQSVSRRWGINYRVNRSLVASLRSHYRWLRRLGGEIR